MESNPNFAAKKDAAPALTEADISSAVTNAFALLSQVTTLKSIMEADASLVEASESERAGLDSLVSLAQEMTSESSTGVDALAKAPARAQFSEGFAKLARSSDDAVTEGGVSFAEMNTFVSRCFSDNA